MGLTTLKITIKFLPEDQPQAGLLAFIFSINLSSIEIIIAFIIIIIVLNIAAGSMVYSKFNKIKKRRQAREATLASVRQKETAEEEKKRRIFHTCRLLKV